MVDVYYVLALFLTYEMSFMKIYSSQIVPQFFYNRVSFLFGLRTLEAGFFIITAM